VLTLFLNLFHFIQDRLFIDIVLGVKRKPEEVAGHEYKRRLECLDEHYDSLSPSDESSVCGTALADVFSQACRGGFQMFPNQKVEVGVQTAPRNGRDYERMALRKELKRLKEEIYDVQCTRLNSTR